VRTNKRVPRSRNVESGIQPVGDPLTVHIIDGAVSALRVDDVSMKEEERRFTIRLLHWRGWIPWQERPHLWGHSLSFQFLPWNTEQTNGVLQVSLESLWSRGDSLEAGAPHGQSSGQDQSLPLCGHRQGILRPPVRRLAAKTSLGLHQGYLLLH